MQWTWEMKQLEETYPDFKFTWGHIEALNNYWREFYEHPKKWKGTELERIIFEWFESDEGKTIIERWNNNIGW